MTEEGANLPQLVIARGASWTQGGIVHKVKEAVDFLVAVMGMV